MNQMSFNLIDEFISFMQHNRICSNHTINAYHGDINQFFACIEEERFENINLEYISLWLSKLRDNQVGNRSINRKISAIKAFFNYLHKYHNIENNAIQKLKSLKCESRLISYIDSNLIINIISNLDNVKKYKSSFELKRDKAIISMLFGCGLRISELLSLKYNDINFDTEYVTIIGKGKKERSIPLLDYNKNLCIEYKKEIDSLLNEKTRSINLFLSTRGNCLTARWVQQMFVDIKRYFNINERFTPHVMRHSCATGLFENDAGIKHIQDLLGHKNLNTTQVYTKVQKKKLKQKLEKLNW